MTTHPQVPWRLAILLSFILSLPLGAAAQTGPCPNGQPLAFPGAEGFGRCSQGGRGGPVIDVTNLNNSGPGSLRDCAEVRTEPRICRIMVAGTVSLGTFDIMVRNDYLTIDGSLYPMALKDGGITVRASHTIIRHLRIRPGNAAYAARGMNANGISYLSREDGSAIAEHIADHVSVSWTTDDSIGIVYGATNITIQDSIISEGLISGPNCGNCSSKGILVGTGNKEKLSVLRTLSAHVLLRFPNASGGEIDWVNNVDYNSSGVTAQIVPFYWPVHINFVGNYLKDGIDGAIFSPYNISNNAVRTSGSFQYSSQSGIFVQDNIARHCTPGVSPPTCVIWGDNGGIAVQSQRYPHPLMTTVSAAAAYDLVLNNSGAMPRDAVDARVTKDVRNGTGRWISDPLTVGGWPTLTAGAPVPPPPPPPTNTPPAFNSQPSNLSVTAGQSATFSATVSGSLPITLQWQKNGAPISGAAGTSYTTPATTIADNGSTFRLVATNAYGSATSNAATLTVAAAPAPPPPPAPAPPAVGYTVSASPPSVAPGSAITVSWTAPIDHSATDWIAMNLVGSQDTAWVSWQYPKAAGSASGSITFTAPAAPGAYEFRYYLNTGWAKAATSNVVMVGSSPPPPAAATDLNADGATNVSDVQLGINQALGGTSCTTGDIDGNGSCNIADVQRIINATLGV